MSARLRVLILAGLLAGCGADPAPPPEPQAAKESGEPAIATAPPPMPGDASGALPTPELQNVGTALGEWTTTDGVASFGAPAGRTLFSLSCDAATRRVRFARLGSDRGGRMRIVTNNAAVNLVARVDPGPATVADLPDTDTFLTALAQAERFGVKLEAGRTLAMPADPAIRVVIGRCRQA